MSQELAKAPAGTPKRDLLDRLVVRVPGLAGLIAGAVLRVKPGSSVRSRLINLQVRRAFAAMARSDVDVVALSYDSNTEVWMRSMFGVGIRDCYYAHQGIRALYADLDEAFTSGAGRSATWSTAVIASPSERTSSGMDGAAARRPQW